MKKTEEDGATKNIKQKPGDNQADEQHRSVHQLYVNMFLDLLLYVIKN